MENMDKIFRNYNSIQAAAYSAGRSNPYDQKLYDIILEYHKTHNGKHHSLLDVGCGTGQVTRSLARFFDQAVGVDPGPEMVGRARKDGGKTRTMRAVEFEVKAAEELGDLGDAKFDMLVSGMAVSAE
jgi:ubiquinone/menaquinone biosynthesis C-methylase UbiE